MILRFPFHRKDTTVSCWPAVFGSMVGFAFGAMAAFAQPKGVRAISNFCPSTAPGEGEPSAGGLSGPAPPKVQAKSPFIDVMSVMEPMMGWKPAPQTLLYCAHLATS